MEEKTALIPEPPKEPSCPNCDTIYTGNFCPHCGQANGTFDKPLRFIVADFAGNIFAFDTRLWNTLKTIFIQPGKMAQDIMNGKRARYMPPFRLYVFVSFIFFLMLNYSVPSNRDFGELENSLQTAIANDSLEIQDSIYLQQMMDSLRIETKKESNNLDLFGNSYELDVPDIIKHPKRYFSKFLRWVSTAMFFLMPIYGFLLWVFFRQTQRHYFGHLILAINQHVFTFLLFIVLMLIEFVFPNNQSDIGTWMMLSIPIYYFLGAHRLYKRSWSTTLMRLALIGLFYGMVGLAALIFIVGITVLE